MTEDPFMGMFTLLILLIMCIPFLGLIIELPLYLEGRKKPELPEYRILKFWRNDLAKYYYQLQRRDKYNVGYDCVGEEGNFKWAQRQAKHYKCKIVKDEDDTYTN